MLWAYCHVPQGSPFDASARIERQFDRFAPGWRDLVVARQVRTAVQLAAYNPNYVGGDIVGGAMDARQVVARPKLSAHPYDTPLPGVLLCSGSTPPGGAVHGMCGWHAAGRALRLGLTIACRLGAVRQDVEPTIVPEGRVPCSFRRLQRPQAGESWVIKRRELVLGQLTGGPLDHLAVGADGDEVRVRGQPVGVGAAVDCGESAMVG